MKFTILFLIALLLAVVTAQESLDEEASIRSIEHCRCPCRCTTEHKAWHQCRRKRFLHKCTVFKADFCKHRPHRKRWTCCCGKPEPSASPSSSATPTPTPSSSPSPSPSASPIVKCPCQCLKFWPAKKQCKLGIYKGCKFIFSKGCPHGTKFKCCDH